MRKIKKGDDVIVITGKDKGKRGTVLRVVDAEHVLVEGANRVKKHQRPIPMKGMTGGIVDKEMPLHVSNVAIFNPATKKADRVGFRMLEDGRKVRFFKSNGEVIDARRQRRQIQRMARLQAHYREHRGAGPDEAVRLQVARCRCRASRRSCSTWAWARRSPTRRSWTTPSAT